MLTGDVLQGGPLHRTISAPPLASAQPQRCLKESLFDFTSIFDGDGLQDSPPPMHKRPTVCNIHATSANDVRPLHKCMHARAKPRSEKHADSSLLM